MRLDRWSSKTELGLQINSLSEVLRQIVWLPFFLSVNGNTLNMIYVLLFLSVVSASVLLIEIVSHFDKYMFFVKTYFMKTRLKNAKAKTSRNKRILNSECSKLIDNILSYGIEYVSKNPPKTLIKLYRGYSRLDGVKMFKDILYESKFDASAFKTLILDSKLDYMESVLSDYIYKYCLLEEIVSTVRIINKCRFEFEVACAFKRLIKIADLIELNVIFERPNGVRVWLENNGFNYKKGAYLVSNKIYKTEYKSLKLKCEDTDNIIFALNNRFKINSASTLSIYTNCGEIFCEDAVSDGAVEYPFYLESQKLKNVFGKKSLICLSDSIEINYDLNTDKELLIKFSFPYFESIGFGNGIMRFKKSGLTMLLKNSSIAYIERINNSIEVYLNVTQGGYNLIYGTRALITIGDMQKKLFSLCQPVKIHTLLSESENNIKYRKKYFDNDGNLCEINYKQRNELNIEFEDKPIYLKKVMFFDKTETYYQFGNYSITVSCDYDKTYYNIISDAIDIKRIFINAENGNFTADKNTLLFCRNGETKKIKIYGTDRVSIKNGIITAAIKNKISIKLGTEKNSSYMLPKTIELNSPDLALNLLLRHPLKFQLIGITAYDTEPKEIGLDAFITMLSAHIYICPDIVMRAIDDLFTVDFTIDKGLYFFNLVFDCVKTMQNDDLLCNADNSYKIEKFLLNGYQHIIDGKEKYAILFLTCVSEFIPYATSESKAKLIDYMENVKRKYALNYKEVCELKEEYPVIYYSDSDDGVIKDIIKMHEYSKNKDDVYDILNKLNSIKNYIFGRSDNPYSFSNDGKKYDTICASLFYRVFLADIIGIKHDKGKLKIEPNLPKSWDYCNAVFHYDNGEYHLCFIKGDKKSVLCDGVASANDSIPLIADDTKYVEVYYD